jgi:HEAT repeat protein
VLAVTQLAVAFAVVLAVRIPTPKPQPNADQPATELSDADLRAQIDTYLGSIDTPIRAEQWAALGPRANPILEQIVRANAMPTRRAKAIDGLAALNGPDAPALFSEVARNEKEPVTVRLAAVRGLGRVASEARVSSALQPLLQHAKDPRVRAAAADQLVQRTNGKSCNLVRAQVSRESANGKLHFARALSRCGE